MKEELRRYIEENIRYFTEANIGKLRSQNKASIAVQDECFFGSISNYIKTEKEDNKFQDLLFKYIDSKNLKDSEVYNSVNIDRRLFSKIRSESYHPSKETVILLGLALKLNEKEFDEFIRSASYYLSKNNEYDLIIRFCFINKIYDIIEVNNLLSEYNCKLLGY